MECPKDAVRQAEKSGGIVVTKEEFADEQATQHIVAMETAAAI